MRPKAQARFMMAAEFESVWSTCLRLQVGTIIVDDDGTRLASGYNGAPYKQPHCNTVEGRCTICCHSETNAGNQAAKNGIRVSRGHMYTMYRPCDACAKNIIQMGLASVFYRFNYDTDGNKDYVINLLQTSGIYVQQLVPTAEELTFSTNLKEWKLTWAYGSRTTQLLSKLTGL